MYVNMVMCVYTFVQRSENNHGYWPSMVLSLRQAAFAVFPLSGTPVSISHHPVVVLELQMFTLHIRLLHGLWGVCIPVLMYAHQILLTTVCLQMCRVVSLLWLYWCLRLGTHVESDSGLHVTRKDISPCPLQGRWAWRNSWDWSQHSPLSTQHKVLAFPSEGEKWLHTKGHWLRASWRFRWRHGS